MNHSYDKLFEPIGRTIKDSEGKIWGTHRTEHDEHVWDEGGCKKMIGYIDQIKGRVTVGTEVFRLDLDDKVGLRPFVMQLPARRGKQIFIYGYDHENLVRATIFLAYVHDKELAMARANYAAQKDAQHDFDEWMRDNGADEISRIKTQLALIRGIVHGMVRMFYESGHWDYKQMICEQWKYRKFLHNQLDKLRRWEDENYQCRIEPLCAG